MPFINENVPSTISGFVWDYAQITATANIVDTAEATGTALITSHAVSYDGTAVELVFFSGALQSPTNAAGDFATVTLFEGGTELTRLATVRNPAAGQALRAPAYALYRFTPTVGVHTYIIAGFTNTVVGVPGIIADTGGALKQPPAFLRITKA